MSKKLKTTRNTAFNSYTDLNKYINSTTSVNATESNPNIRLLNYDEAVYKKGKDIIADSAKNNNIKTITKVDTKIDTKLTDDQDCYIFGSPHKMVFDNRQQYNDCGTVALLNILAQAGIKKITDQNKLETEFTKNLWKLGIADDEGELGVFDYVDGGTNPSVYKEVLEYYGINSEEHFGSGDNPTTDILTLSKYIKDGGSAIAGVSSEILWYADKAKEENISIDHAILVTGVVYDTDSPDDDTTPLGFYVHDTGGWMTRYISCEEFLDVVLNNKLEVDGVRKDGFFATIVTDEIKQATDSIDATGNNSDNNIYGNKANNVIKGLNGNDILIGGNGNDTIYGGNGKDIIFANGVYKNSDELELIKDEGIKTSILNLDYITDETSDKALIGRNFLYGGSGDDYIFGGEYNDYVECGKGNDYVWGEAGIDAIYGGSGNDYIYGGSGNDRLLGGSGKDYIDGGDDDDTIVGGSGNDTIIGGKGADYIECGSGKDTVIFEKGCDIDFVKSSSGSAELFFRGSDDDKTNINDFRISLTKDGKHTEYLNVLLKDSEDGVNFSSFFNSQKNSCKTVYIKDDVHDSSYRVKATKSKGNIKVASASGNNVLISTSIKDNTITTSTGNDIVFMTDGNDVITYRGGEDYYYSTQGNNKYNLSKFDKDSFLSVNDCTGIAGKKDDEGNPFQPSTDDLMDFKTTDADDLALFFDISSNGYVNKSSLYIINKSEVTATSEYFAGVLENNETGVVQINEYFLKANPTTTNNYKGFGYIETIQAKDKDLDIDSSIKQIVHEVVNWLGQEGHTGYTSVSDAINNGADVADLISIFTTQEINLA